MKKLFQKIEMMPDSFKTKFAFTLSLIVTLIIAVFWLMGASSRFANLNGDNGASVSGSATSATSTNDSSAITVTPISNLKDELGQSIEGLKNSVGNLFQTEQN